MNKYYIIFKCNNTLRILDIMIIEDELRWLNEIFSLVKERDSQDHFLINQIFRRTEDIRKSLISLNTDLENKEDEPKPFFLSFIEGYRTDIKTFRILRSKRGILLGQNEYTDADFLNQLIAIYCKEEGIPLEIK